MQPLPLRRVLYWLIPCLIFGWAVSHSPHRKGRDLYPSPDALEYALLADRLAHFEAPLIQVGVWEFPARYPLSYPILLAPFAWFFSVSHIWIASFVLGMIATFLIARTGRWLIGSRAAGGLAACFWALHPATIESAITNMSEMGLIVVWLLMLEAARPWIEGRNAKQNIVRALVAGLVIGWLTVAKAPFVYWAGAIGLMMLLWGDRRHALAFGAVFVVCCAAHIVYQRWAFGAWGMNGYKFWDPKDYNDISVVFNPRYIFHAWEGMWPGQDRPPGNLVFYGKAVLGLTHDFYAPYMGVTLIVAAVCALWPGRRGRPARTTLLLMAGWAAAGFAFCALYFFQTVRFVFVWIVLADWLAAWGLVHVPLWSKLRRGAARRFRLKSWAQITALIVAALLIRGEWRRDRFFYFESTERGRPALADLIPPLLKQVGEGEWLISNFQLPLMPYYRAHPGPNAALYASSEDFMLLNGHAFTAYQYALKAKRMNAEQTKYIGQLPVDWYPGTMLLINPSGHWQIKAGDRRRLFEDKPVWLLMVRPEAYLPMDRLRDEKIWPMLTKEATVQKVAEDREAALYRLDWKVPAEIPDDRHE